MIELKFKRLSTEAVAPERGSENAACFDLFALEDVEFGPGEIKLVKTGWACEVPKGCRTNLYVRSSTPIKKGFILANSVGIIDNDYRGELMVQLMNVKTTDAVRLKDTAVFTKNRIKKGQKIAQLEVVLNTGPEVKVVEVDELSDTKRGAGGFGSTGD